MARLPSRRIGALTALALVIGPLGTCGRAAEPAGAPPTIAPDKGATWTVTEDPAPQPLKFKLASRTSVPIRGSYEPFTSVPHGAFVGIRDTSHSDKTTTFMSLDLRTGALTPMRFTYSGDVARAVLSPDALYTAVSPRRANKDAPPGAAVEVWSYRTGKVVASVPADLGKAGDHLAVIGFTANGELLCGTQGDERGDVLMAVDVKTGKRRTQLLSSEHRSKWARDRFGPSYAVPNWSISPGGRLLAEVTGDGLRVYDAKSLALVGRAAGPADMKDAEPPSVVTFDAEGTRAVALFARGGDGHRVVAWDLASGNVASDVSVPRSRDRLEEAGVIAFEPVPGGGYRLGTRIIDAESGKEVYDVTALTGKVRLAFTRMLAPGHAVFSAETSGGRRAEVVAAALPKARIDAVADAVRAGGKAIDATLPPVTAADRGAPRTLLPVPTGADWDVPVDSPGPLPTLGRGFGLRTFKAPAANDNVGRTDLREVVLGGAPRHVAAVAYPTEGVRRAGDYSGARVPPVKVLVDGIQLADGATTFSFTAAGEATVMDLSGDGKSILLRHGADRLDLYTIVPGRPPQHVVGWRPVEVAEGEHVNANRLELAHLVDAGHVLTHVRGETVMWELPACKAVWAVKGGEPALSPTRKYVAIPDAASGVSLIDPIAGRVVATLDVRGRQARRVAFDATGTRLAARMTGNTYVVWDLQDGRVIHDFALPSDDLQRVDQFVGNVLLFCGTDYLLTGQGQLISLKRGAVIWEFAGPPWADLPLPRGSDGRVWSSQSRPVPGLYATKLPHPEALAAEAALPAGWTLEPGAAVAIDLSGVAATMAQAERDALKAELSAKLVEHGFKPDDDAAVKLVATTVAGPDGQAGYAGGPMHWMRQRPDFTLTYKTWRHTLTLVAGTTTLWKQSAESGSPLSQVTTDKPAEAQGQIDAAQEKHKRFSVRTFTLPQRVSTAALTDAAAIGYSKLTPKGPVATDRPRPQPPQ